MSCFYNLSAKASEADQRIVFLEAFAWWLKTMIWMSGVEVKRTESWEQGTTVGFQLKENRSRVRPTPTTEVTKVEITEYLS